MRGPARLLAVSLLGCLAVSPLAVPTDAADQTAPPTEPQVQLIGTVWIVDSQWGEPPTSPPHRQGGVEVDLGRNSRIVDVTRSDEAGHWSFQGFEHEFSVGGLYTASESPTLPFAPGWVGYTGVSDLRFPVEVTVETVDLTLWRYDRSRGTRGPCTRGTGKPFQFSGGLLALSFALGEVMGQPLECAHVASNGDVLQATSTGLAYQVAGSDQYVFTDGSQQWTLGRDGEVEAISD
jgi:hypothetical protein